VWCKRCVGDVSDPLPSLNGVSQGRERRMATCSIEECRACCIDKGRTHRTVQIRDIWELSLSTLLTRLRNSRNRPNASKAVVQTRDIWVTLLVAFEQAAFGTGLAQYNPPPPRARYRRKIWQNDLTEPNSRCKSPPIQHFIR
jgi:hypothetical protein